MMRPAIKGHRVRAVAAALTALAAVVVVSGPGQGAVAATPGSPVTASTVPTPSLQPVPYTAGKHHFPFDATKYPLASYGYTENEYFFSGTTNTYAPDGTWTTNGNWPTKITSSGNPYKSRILVRAPKDPRDFSGKVIVEWLNTSGTVDADPDWGQGHDQILRDGDAYVGVSAQDIGVSTLRLWDQQRYGSLFIGNGKQAYDIFSQAGKLIRADAETILGTRRPLTLIGAGESQSAIWLTTYANAIQNSARIYDGLLIHSRSFGNVPVGGIGSASFVVGAHIRDDLDIPVLQLMTETDVALGFSAARQPDSDRLRTWEVAGTAHFDAYGLSFLENEIGGAVGLPPMTVEQQQAFFGCAAPFNNLPFHYVENTAIHDLAGWAAGGPPPPSAAPIDTRLGVVQRDASGNALGGLRTPGITVPVATYGAIGHGTPGKPLSPFICVLFGSTTPFSASQLATLYPTHADYVQKVTAAALADEKEGYLLRPDVQAIIATARQSSIGT